jgi:hypothetical protein
MWSNDKDEQRKWIETYLVPYKDVWKEHGITISMSYYDGRLEDGSGQLTDIVKCDTCGFQWKDLLNHPKDCPHCKGIAEKRPDICLDKSILFDKTIKNLEGKTIQKDEKVVYKCLEQVSNLKNNIDFKVGYKRGYLESDFYIPSHDINIECQGEQHFFPVDINDDPLKTDDDRDIMLIEQIIRDVAKFNGIYNKRVLYYINSDNVRVDEYDFIHRAINSIENTISKQIKENPDRVEKAINIGIYRHYLPNSVSIGNFNEYIMQYIHDMYKPNRIFKNPNSLCEIVKKYLLT